MRVANLPVSEWRARGHREGMKAVFASPLLTSADVVMPVSNAAFRTYLLIDAALAQFGQEHACLVIGHRADRFLSDRDGIGRQPKMRGHGRTLIQDCGGAWKNRSMPTRYRSGYGFSELSSCCESNQKSGVRSGLLGRIGPG